MKTPSLPGLVDVLVYETNNVHFISVCFNVIKWFQKIRQVYDPGTEMVRDAHFFRLNVNNSYMYNMNSVDIICQLRNVYQVDHWMRNYKWWWSILFWGHGLVRANAYIIYKISLKRARRSP